MSEMRNPRERKKVEKRPREETSRRQEVCLEPTDKNDVLRSNHAYDPLRYVGVYPYPDSRGPPEDDPTPDTFGRSQVQLYSTAYYYDRRNMIRQGFRMKRGRGNKPQCVEDQERGMPQAPRPPKPAEPDGRKDGFRLWTSHEEFEKFVTSRLFGSFPHFHEGDWRLTRGWVKKLYDLNNEFYRMRQEGIIEAVSCVGGGGGGSRSAGGLTTLSDPAETSIFGFQTMLVRQPEFCQRITRLVDDKFNIRAKPCRPGDEGVEREAERDGSRGRQLTGMGDEGECGRAVAEEHAWPEDVHWPRPACPQPAPAAATTASLAAADPEKEICKTWCIDMESDT